MSQISIYGAGGGGGGGTVTSITFNGGLTSTPDPVTTIGTATLDQTNLTVLDGTVYWDTGTQRLNTTATGTVGQFLRSGGVGVAPAYATLPASSISITGDSGGALVGSAFTFTGGTTGLTFSGAVATETLGGTLGIANGGTNATSMANTFGVNYFDGTRIVTTAVGTATHVLTSNGPGVAPTFQAGGGGGGGITTINGDTGSATGATVSFDAQTQAGGTIFFNASGSAVSLDVTDVRGNTYFGLTAGNTTNTANQSAAFGAGCLPAVTSGNYNCAIGNNALFSLQTGEGNVGIGTDPLFSLNAGNHNFGMGFLTLFQLATGSSNIAIGHQNGFNYTGAESFNILIGESLTGTVGENGVTRIGTPGSQTKAFMSGIFGVTVNVGTGLPVLIDNTDQMGTVLSTKRVKENIKDMNGYSDALMKLRPVTFNYISDKEKRIVPGLIAEEVIGVMPDLVVEDNEGEPFAVKYHDLPALLLNEIQKLRKEVDELKRRL